MIWYNRKLKKRAQYLRNNSTPGEIALWNQLKGKQLCGYDFNRQKPLLNYIVDFYCITLKLVIEIDGASHENKVQYDLRRQKELESYGLVVLRFTEFEARHKTEQVVQSMENWILGITNTPSPS